MSEAGFLEEKLPVEERFREFLESYEVNGRVKYKDEIRNAVAERRASVVVDFTDVIEFDQELAEEIVENPLETLDKLDQVVTEIASAFANKKYPMRVRFTNLPEKVRLRDLRERYVGKLVAFDGIVTKATNVKGKPKKLYFRCEACGTVFPVEQRGKYYQAPTVCPNPECPKKTGPFTLLENHPKNEYVDWQLLVVQEKPEELPPGQMPRSIEVIVEGKDLVDVARPGDRVTVIGVLEAVPNRVPKRGSMVVFDFKMIANNIEVSQKVLEDVHLSPEDVERIKELSKDPWIHKSIILSIAPAIYGHWDIKEAIAFALFGGVPKELEDGTRIRGDIHVLIIGDPGTAKSQLLQYAARIAPRSVYTTGKGSTAAGLTAAVVRDNITGEYYLEAGALVLADGGVAVIDEIDKMREEDRSAIHEAMEQQTVSIAKAGIVAKLNARCAVLAAGNPRYGRYVPERSVAENINLPPSILSRFDLIFVLRDVPDPKRDRRLVRYILNVHKEADKIVPEIPADLLKKYIAYARKSVKPKLSEAAARIIENFFVDLRKTAAENPEMGVPITARQLEALVRMSEAHAKMALRSVVEEADAIEAVRMMLAFLSTAGVDVETGRIDIDTIYVGVSKSNRQKRLILKDIIKEKFKEKGTCVHLKEVVREARKRGLNEEEIEQILTQMVNQGEIYEPKTACYSPL
ncbi:minichromosome maintenance protein MCM [Ignicoccus hospitalis]|uniref:DNA helicase n=1 Tax=Ignicoccus hospitalis (strain KIN4/I / DSM 18386 / JCM 14125) TaxID=453591 RepID=A8AC21_IGNH4|nr:minichromosome maintenance protein MCM [Ignicoccus hospitalis]ABU82473.1 replicative DNA helicase Mcm [Ignicoccus hospitalis KIN4/I]HIH90568.1 minichromosome maintenance protein MCM [Desulfurococcaceae archaeon]